MFWSKKKKSEAGKSLPDLPSYPSAAPSMRDYNKVISGKEESEEKIHALPSFPDSPMKRGFAQSAIKEAVKTTEVEEKELPPLPDIPGMKEKLLAERESAGLPIPPPRVPRVMEISEWKPGKTPVSAPQKIMEAKPIFVRLDKFQEAQESLEVVKEKLSDIDGLLRTLREVKMKEDHELSTWEKEIESIKARIAAVTSGIFESSY